MTDRDIRHFAVYTDGRLALVVRDEPGPLRSTAAPPAGAGGPPPPPGPPPGPGEPVDAELPAGVHPFIDAQAYDPVSEDRLRRLLGESSSFDDYLERLVGAGFDIASCRPLEGLDYALPDGVRLTSEAEVAGACWPVPGQFTTLEHQPADGEQVFDVATATAYRPASGGPLLEALRAAGSFEDLLERLRAAGFSVSR
jgi:hypothetical protein